MFVWPTKLSTNHAYHSGRLPLMQHAVWHLLQMNSSAVTFDSAEMTFIFSLISLAESIDNKGGKETKVSGQNCGQQAPENAPY